MKEFRFTIGLFAIMFGSMGALSFSTVEPQVTDQYGEFYVNPDGSRGEAISGEHYCSDQSNILCCQEYNITTGQPSGNLSKMHYGPRP